jgi:hypothetical protein
VCVVCVYVCGPARGRPKHTTRPLTKRLALSTQDKTIQERAGAGARTPPRPVYLYTQSIFLLCPAAGRAKIEARRCGQRARRPHSDKWAAAGRNPRAAPMKSRWSRFQLWGAARALLAAEIK